jgi:hypothetical protein
VAITLAERLEPKWCRPICFWCTVMDIGTAKPGRRTPRVPHHLIDVTEVDQP